MVSGSRRHGHGHQLSLLAGATSSIGLSTALWDCGLVFFPRRSSRQILKRVRHMGSWHEQIRLAQVQVYKELGSLFIYFFFSPLTQTKSQT